MEFSYIYVIIGNGKSSYETNKVLSVCLSKEDAKRAVAFYSEDYYDVDYEVFTPESFDSFELIYEGTFIIELLNSENDKIFEIKNISYTTSTICRKKGVNVNELVNFKFCQCIDMNGETDSKLTGTFKFFKNPNENRKEWKKWLIDEINKKITGLKIVNIEYDF